MVRRTEQFLRPMVDAAGAALAGRWFRSQTAKQDYLRDEGPPAPVDTLNYEAVAYNWDGTNDFVAIPLDAEVVFPWSYCCWFKIDDYSADSPLISVYGNDFASEFYYIRVKTTGAIDIERSNAAALAASTITVAPAGSVSSGKWHHILVAFPSATEMKVYLDGYPIYSGSGLTSVPMGANFTNMALGSDEYFASLYHDGSLYDVRLYDREITASEAAKIYNSTKRPGNSPQTYFYSANLIGHWRLDEAESGVTPWLIVDSSGRDQKPIDLALSATSTDVTMPLSLKNEIGCVDLLQYPFPAFDGLTHLEQTMASYAAAWTASGANATASVINALGHTNVLKAHFTSGATAGQKCYAAGITHALPAPPANSFGLVRVRLSRALTGSERVEIGLNDSSLLTVVKALKGPTAPLADSDSTPFANQWRNGICLNAVETSVGGELAVTIVGALTADLTVYVSDFMVVHTAGTDPGVLYYGLPFHRFLPSLSSNNAQDVWGSSLETVGPLGKRAALINSACITLDGANDYLSSPDFLQGGTALSVSAWIYTSMNDSTPPTVVSHGDISGNQRSWYMGISDGTLAVFISPDGGLANFKDYRGQFQINDLQWHHIGFTFSPNDLRLYVDGIEIEPLKLTDNTVNSLHNSTAPVLIGALLNGGSPIISSTFGGRIADVRIYESTLTAANMLEIYQDKPLS